MSKIAFFYSLPYPCAMLIALSLTVEHFLPQLASIGVGSELSQLSSGASPLPYVVGLLTSLPPFS
uniref:Uncharacterized protein n=1 Tax=Utricularia reniformis TaxID=192314 RepID=A0A1Y0B063_9LAMI|nr:hypothetical protein AEK19_MT0559 [Utricularia reniformis]ART30815.1 hypothetical protein AEK19_MT0559 [Utricularia reniformis]